MEYLSANTVSKKLGVTAQTLRNWDKLGKLKPAYVKSNGYRYYSIDDILSFTQERKTKKNIKVIGYARVSSKKQNDDLERQVENLNKILESKYTDFEIISDIGSGINYTKPGLRKLIELINKKEVDLIIVLYKDRLVRFGFELIEYFAKLNNVNIEILDKKNKDDEQEFVEELVQIITLFSSKLQGKRKGKTKEIIDSISKSIEENK